MTKSEVVKSHLSVCSSGGEEGRVKGSCGDGSQYSACPGLPGSLLLSQSHGFGAERYLLQKKDTEIEMLTIEKYFYSLISNHYSIAKLECMCVPGEGMGLGPSERWQGG